MRAVDEGRLASNSLAFERHINRCLGCRACEPVCPAGVEYGQLLEGARAELHNADVKPGVTQRLLRFALRHIWLSSSRLKFAFAGARLARDSGLGLLLLKSKLPRLISRQFEFGLALLESSKPASFVTSVAPTTAGGSVSLPAVPATSGEPVLLFKGCVTEGLFSRVNQATERVLRVNGCTTRTPETQTCCGALHAHAGDLAGARQLARENIEAFTDSGEAPIITNAGGCGAMLVSYAHLLAEDEQWAERALHFSSRVRDVSQQLNVTGIKAGGPIPSERITYDASCHLINGQHAGTAPLRMLEAIPELDFVPLEGSDRCCGGAGVYNLMEPELSAIVLGEKLACVRETGASVLATGNPGCHMQLGAGAMLANASLRVCHPVELLDESYRRAGLSAEGEGPNH
jgi:glycolate oxidase iron-sulfur subunit